MLSILSLFIFISLSDIQMCWSLLIMKIYYLPALSNNKFYWHGKKNTVDSQYICFNNKRLNLIIKRYCFDSLINDLSSEKKKIINVFLSLQKWLNLSYVSLKEIDFVKKHNTF